jgi:predicted transcriptional regulator of viral defense system
MPIRDADKSRQTRPKQQKTGDLAAFFRPGQLERLGMTRNQLRSLLRSGRVERVGRGLYHAIEHEPTENYSLALVSARVPNSIICLISALRFHGIGTRAPAAVWLAIPHKARMPKVPEVRLRVVRFSGPAWTFGVTDVEFEGVAGRITTPARTIADCFRFERLVGAEVATEALTDALKQRKVTVAQLSRVEEVLPSRRLRAALDTRI